jgi:hypothetical protein
VRATAVPSTTAQMFVTGTGPSTTVDPFGRAAAPHPNTPETTAVVTQGASGGRASTPNGTTAPSGSSGLAYTGSDSLWIGAPGLVLLAVGEVGRRVLSRRRLPAGAPAP